MSPTSRPKEILKTIDEDEDDIEGLKEDERPDPYDHTACTEDSLIRDPTVNEVDSEN
ncbi:hypothetical protein V8E53_003456 [Lactarius tabidus]